MSIIFYQTLRTQIKVKKKALNWFYFLKISGFWGLKIFFLIFCSITLLINLVVYDINIIKLRIYIVKNQSELEQIDLIQPRPIPKLVKIWIST